MDDEVVDTERKISGLDFNSELFCLFVRGLAALGHFLHVAYGLLGVIAQEQIHGHGSLPWSKGRNSGPAERGCHKFQAFVTNDGTESRLPRRKSVQYGGFFRARCAFAASTHQVKSSAKRGNAPASALPPSPIGLPSSESVCEIGPAEIVDDTTTMPISDSVPCHITAARAPAKRPAE